MKFFDNFIQETNKYDIVFYRLFAVLGILTFPLFSFLYEMIYGQQYTKYFATIFVIIIYVLFLITTLVKRLVKYAYLLAVISVYTTILFFIYLMIMMGFQMNTVLTLSMAISILASVFKNERTLNIYLVSKISLSIISIFIWDEFSSLMVVNIMLIIVWPFLIYYILKSKFIDKENIEKNSIFLQMVFKSTKDPTVIIDCKTLKIINCSESALTLFDVVGRESIIGKTINEVNILYLNNILTEDILLNICNLSNGNFEFKINLKNKKVYYKVSSNEFKVDNKLYSIFTILDNTKIKEKTDIIYNLAFIDELTKINNRRSGVSELAKSIIQHKKMNRRFAVYFIDIDRFKEINDNYGHQCGDRVLIKIANILEISTGINDVVSRIGGDEFMIIVKDISDIRIIDSIAKRIIQKAQTPIFFEDKEISVTVSVGIAIFPEYGKNYNDLMRNADKALYQAKKNGRNQFSIFDE